jgi:FkbM family methyltransferase
LILCLERVRGLGRQPACDANQAVAVAPRIGHKTPMSIEKLIGFEGRIHVADIGAAAIAETPPYKPLLDRGLGRLSAVDGDERQIPKLVETYGPETRVHSLVLGDGSRRRLHLCTPESGMSSLLRPSPQQLAFFNGFDRFGAVKGAVDVDTVRLADVEELQAIDFLKMDIQGAELMVLENAGAALDSCVAIQLEASFITLYEGQPTFGEIDLWMRRHGFHPHRFTDVKHWSIAPTVRDNNYRVPFNQLLECDIVYMRGLIDLKSLSDDQIRKMLLIAIYAYSSPDLMVHCARELERRGVVTGGTATKLLGLMRR